MVKAVEVSVVPISMQLLTGEVSLMPKMCSACSWGLLTFFRSQSAHRQVDWELFGNILFGNAMQQPHLTGTRRAKTPVLVLAAQ